ncbi:MAG: porin family protein [bacterium]
MRKVFGLVCAVLFVAGISSVARAQNLSFGVKAGLNFANLSPDPAGEYWEGYYGGYPCSDSYAYAYKITGGIALGGFAVYKVNDNLSIQPELLYTQKGAKVEWTDTFKYEDWMYQYTETYSGECDVELNYIEIPVLVKYSISPGGDIRPFVFGGPALGILMGAKADSEDIKSDCKSTELSIVLGGGVDYGIYSVDLRYSMGMTKVFNEGDEKNSVISLMVGYKL